MEFLAKLGNNLELSLSWLEYGVYKGASGISKFPRRIWSAPQKCQAVVATLPPIIMEIRKWVPPTVATGSWRYQPLALHLLLEPTILVGKNKQELGGFWDFPWRFFTMLV